MLAYSSLTAHLHIMEPTAHKSQNFAWRAPLGLTAEEQCGLFARTVDPSPWSIPIKYSNTRISVADATPTRFRPLPIFQPTSLNQLFITRSPASASSDLGLLLFFFYCAYCLIIGIFPTPASMASKDRRTRLVYIPNNKIELPRRQLPFRPSQANANRHRLSPRPI